MSEESVPALAIMRDREPEVNKLNMLVFKHRLIFSNPAATAYAVWSVFSLVNFVGNTSVFSLILAVGFAALFLLAYALTKRRNNLVEQGEIIYLPRYSGGMKTWQKNLGDYSDELEKLRLGALKSPEVRSAYMRLEPLAWENIKKAERTIRALHSNDTMDSNTRGEYQRDLAFLIESEKHIISSHQAANGLELERARADIDPEPSREVSTNINAQLSALRQLGSGD